MAADVFCSNNCVQVKTPACFETYKSLVYEKESFPH